MSSRSSTNSASLRFRGPDRDTSVGRMRVPLTQLELACAATKAAAQPRSFAFGLASSWGWKAPQAAESQRVLATGLETAAASRLAPASLTYRCPDGAPRTRE